MGRVQPEPDDTERFGWVMFGGSGERDGVRLSTRLPFLPPRRRDSVNGVAPMDLPATDPVSWLRADLCREAIEIRLYLVKQPGKKLGFDDLDCGLFVTARFETSGSEGTQLRVVLISLATTPLQFPGGTEFI